MLDLVGCCIVLLETFVACITFDCPELNDDALEVAAEISGCCKFFDGPAEMVDALNVFESERIAEITFGCEVLEGPAVITGCCSVFEVAVGIAGG